MSNWSDYELNVTPQLWVASQLAHLSGVVTNPGFEPNHAFPLVDNLHYTVDHARDTTVAMAAVTEGLQLQYPHPFGLKEENFHHTNFLANLSSVSEEWTDDSAFVPTTVAYGVAFILGVLGNSLVALALLGDRKYRSLTSSFLVSLAVADIVFLLVCVPYEIVAKMSSSWTGGRVLCKLGGFVEMLTASSSVLNLTAVSMERYDVIFN